MLQAPCPRRKIPAAPSLAPPNHVLTNEIHTARNGSQLFEAPFYDLLPFSLSSACFPFLLVFSALRLEKRALPRPVPMVSTPQRLTSCINGISERPCPTPSLYIVIAVSCFPICGRSSRSAA